MKSTNMIVINWHLTCVCLLMSQWYYDSIFGQPYYRSAFGTMCRLSSVCLSSVTFCIVPKRYVLAKKCLKEWIGNQRQKVDFLVRHHISTSGYAATATETAVFALFLPVQPNNQYYMVEINFLAANHVHIFRLCGLVCRLSVCRLWRFVLWQNGAS